MKRSVILAIAIVLLLSSCGAPKSADNGASDSAGYSSPEYSYAEQNKGSGGGGGIGGAPIPVQEAPEYRSEESAAEVQSPRKLIKRASLNIETKDFEGAITAAEQLCADFGGYIENSSVYGGDKAYLSSYADYGYYNQRSADYTMRIPEKNYDAFLRQAGSIGNVTYKAQNAEDITDTYYDMASRLAAAETRRDRLMALLEKADTMDSIIQLERALSDTIYEIDGYAGTLKRYDNQVDYSYFTISLTEVVEFTPDEPTPPITLGERIGYAASDAWNGLVNGAQALLVWIIRNIFTLIILAAIALAAILIVRRVNNKDKKGKKPNTPQNKSDDETKQ
jgi:hypothetical protein